MKNHSTQNYFKPRDKLSMLPDCIPILLFITLIFGTWAPWFATSAVYGEQLDGALVASIVFGILSYLLIVYMRLGNLNLVFALLFCIVLVSLLATHVFSYLEFRSGILKWFVSPFIAEVETTNKLPSGFFDYVLERSLRVKDSPNYIWGIGFGLTILNWTLGACFVLLASLIGGYVGVISVHMLADKVFRQKIKSHDTKKHLPDELGNEDYYPVEILNKDSEES
jgi:hypothetical protein